MDTAQVENALLNLAINARDAMEVDMANLTIEIGNTYWMTPIPSGMVT